MAVIAAPTATPTDQGAGTIWRTRRVTSAAVILPTTADHGWARGEFGTQNTSTAVAPSGAIKKKDDAPSLAAKLTTRAHRMIPRTAPRPARSCSRPWNAGSAG